MHSVCVRTSNFCTEAKSSLQKQMPHFWNPAAKEMRYLLSEARLSPEEIFWRLLLKCSSRTIVFKNIIVRLLAVQFLSVPLHKPTGRTKTFYSLAATLVRKKKYSNKSALYMHSTIGNVALVNKLFP